MKRFKWVSEALLATLFPTPCQVCGRLVETSANGVACQACWDQLTLLSPADGCERCGYPSLSPTPQVDRTDCARCRYLSFSCARACGSYEGALRASILQLKVRPFVCRRLSDMLQSSFECDERLRGSTLILPVPLHRERLGERGFNQAELLAEKLSGRVKVAMDAESLVRTKPTAKHRAGMDPLDRSQSVRSAFRVTRPRLIDGQAVLLVDDLFTTGSTLSACAGALFSAGASRVNLLTLARVI